jgi:hypothetical protein
MVQKLRQVDVLVGHRMQRMDAIREVRLVRSIITKTSRTHRSGN